MKPEMIASYPTTGILKNSAHPFVTSSHHIYHKENITGLQARQQPNSTNNQPARSGRSIEGHQALPNPSTFSPAQQRKSQHYLTTPSSHQPPHQS
jgi:hypothetical protein